MSPVTPAELLLLLKFGGLENVLWHIIEIDHQRVASRFTPEERVTAGLLETKEFKKYWMERMKCKN